MFVEGGPHPEQIKALRKMSLAQRLETGLAFMEEMRQLKAAALRVQHPDWTEEQVTRALREFVMHGAA
jgi:hypothetical protein